MGPHLKILLLLATLVNVVLLDRQCARAFCGLGDKIMLTPCSLWKQLGTLLHVWARSYHIAGVCAGGSCQKGCCISVHPSWWGHGQQMGNVSGSFFFQAGHKRKLICSQMWASVDCLTWNKWGRSRGQNLPAWRGVYCKVTTQALRMPNVNMSFRPPNLVVLTMISENSLFQSSCMTSWAQRNKKNTSTELNLLFYSNVP